MAKNYIDQPFRKKRAKGMQGGRKGPGAESSGPTGWASLGAIEISLGARMERKIIGAPTQKSRPTDRSSFRMVRRQAPLWFFAPRAARKVRSRGGRTGRWGAGPVSTVHANPWRNRLSFTPAHSSGKTVGPYRGNAPTNSSHWEALGRELQMLTQWQPRAK